MAITIKRYTPEAAAEWNDFVRKARQRTFLFDRRYMDYHADRFPDYSLMVYEDGRLVALLPATSAPLASFREEEPAASPAPDGSAVGNKLLSSHAGLTYGGLITDERMTAALCLSVFESLRNHLKAEGFTTLIYKTIPWIYCRIPSEEDLYAIFSLGASKLLSRNISSAIMLDNPPKWRNGRHCGISKARRSGVVVEPTDSEADYKAFWNVLETNLMETHEARPVHSVSEILLLHSCFPENIKLYVARREAEVIGGVLLYDFGSVVHTQYISASQEGKRCCAIDLIMHRILHEDLPKTTAKYFDFGTSMDPSTDRIQESLIFQKEGFGARAICYDTYEITI